MKAAWLCIGWSEAITEQEKGILFQKNEKEKQSSAFFIREHAPRRRRFLSSALCESRRKKNC